MGLDLSTEKELIKVRYVSLRPTLGEYRTVLIPQHLAGEGWVTVELP